MNLQSGLEKRIKVSVCVVTYNQKSYLRQCLDSLVCQDLNCDYEIIVGDDASTDGTAALVMEYAEKFPNLVIPVLHKKNLGPTKNYISIHSRARGEYVCHMDGDDVAFPEKLQKQTDLLDKDKTCVLVWHKVNVFNDAGEINKILHNKLNEIVDVSAITKSDFLKYGMLGAHSSTMYRRSAAPNFNLVKGEVLDYFLIGLILNFGNACRIEEILGGYRLNANKKTLSKNKSLYFNKSPIRKLYCKHLAWFFLQDGRCRQSIFLNALFNLFVDIRFLRPTAIDFLFLSVRSFSISGILNFPKYYSEAMKIRGFS